MSLILSFIGKKKCNYFQQKKAVKEHESKSYIVLFNVAMPTVSIT